MLVSRSSMPARRHLAKSGGRLGFVLDTATGTAPGAGRGQARDDGK